MKKFLSLLISLAVLLSCCTFVVCAENDKQNLLTNGGFEETLLGSGNSWGFTQTNGWYVGVNGGLGETNNDEHHTGSSSLKLSNATAGQRLQLEANGIYTLKAYVKGTAGSAAKINIDNGAVDYPDSDSGILKSEQINVTGEWQEITVEYTCTASGAHVICLEAWENENAVYFDDVTLFKTGEREYTSVGIINGSFNEDDLTGWIEKGDGKAMVNDSVLTITQPTEGDKIYQTVTEIEDGIYDLTVYAKTDSIDGIVYAYAKSPGHTVISTAIPMSDQWMTVLIPGIEIDSGQCEIGVYAEGDMTVSIDGFSMETGKKTRLPFLKGGEISKLTYVEDMGGKFYRADGTEADALQIMAENGFNLARIRLLDDPGKGHGDGAYYLPQGYMTEEDCLNLARRAKDKGMQILFSFAYSDFWVDGEKQYMPHKWQEEITAKGLSGEDMYNYLENKTYEYTKDMMQKLIAQGTCPEYVSIGNEIQIGMYFGHWQDKSPLYNNATFLSRILNAGARAVRETSPDTKIVLHSDHAGAILDGKRNSAGQNQSARTTFKSALEKVDYDVIGVSYYPYYIDTVSIDDVVKEFNNMILRYNKDVIIMETGYNWIQYTPYTYEEDGETVNVLGQLKNSGYYQDIYGESQEGQRAFLTELYAKLKQVAGGRCIGDLYWDPVMIYVEDEYGTNKVGWAMKTDEWGEWTEYNVVPNSTIFDFGGKAVKGQSAMKYNTNSSDRINITGKMTDGTDAVKNTKITFTVNGSRYNTTTDQFGEYMVSVPYPADGNFVITAKGCTENHTETAPTDGVLLNSVDFATYNDTVTSDEFFVNGVIDVAGNLNYEVDYTDNVKNPLVYTALYDESDNLIGCRKGREGSFGKQDAGKYKLKTYLWKDNHEPVRTTAEIQIEYN